jgi:type 1 fimbria pilin
MKNIDIKSVIVGVLATVLIIVSMGATNQDENLGDIVVNSIKVVNENGKLAAILNADESGVGFGIYNNDGKSAVILNATESGVGFGIYNNDGKSAVILNVAESGGGLWIYNKHEKQVVALQANSNSDGAIGLYDRYGDPGWAKTGRQ